MPTKTESTAESKAECGAYFTVVHSHGVAHFTIYAQKPKVARVKKIDAYINFLTRATLGFCASTKSHKKNMFLNKKRTSV